MSDVIKLCDLCGESELYYRHDHNECQLIKDYDAGVENLRSALSEAEAEANYWEERFSETESMLRDQNKELEQLRKLKTSMQSLLDDARRNH